MADWRVRIVPDATVDGVAILVGPWLPAEPAASTNPTQEDT